MGSQNHLFFKISTQSRALKEVNFVHVSHILISLIQSYLKSMLYLKRNKYRLTREAGTGYRNDTRTIIMIYSCSMI